MKNRQMSMLTKTLVLSSAICLLLSTTSSAYTATEYPTTREWQLGMVAALGENSSPIPASLRTLNYVGVVTGVEKGIVEIADSGLVDVLVTDRDGVIKKGDKIGISSVAGIANIWSPGQIVVGVVKKEPSSWQSIQIDGDGTGKTTIRVASVPVQILDESSGLSESSNAFLYMLQRTGNGVAGKPIDLWRIITALLIGLGGLIMSFGLLFISSRESFFSMGRNPMAGKMIMHGLWKMIGLSVLVMCGTLTVSYLILRLG